MSTILQIVQPKVLKNGYEIRDGNRLAGRLTCGGYLRPHAEAEAGAAAWRFAGSGLVRQKIKVYGPAGDLAIGLLTSNFFSANSSTEIGQNTYKLIKTSRWKQRFAWRDDLDGDLLTYNIGGFAKLVGEIEITKKFAKHQDRDLIMLLGLYKIKLDIDMESAAVAGSVAGAAVVASS